MVDVGGSTKHITVVRFKDSFENIGREMHHYGAALSCVQRRGRNQ